MSSMLEIEDPASEIRPGVLSDAMHSGFSEAVRLTVHETVEKPTLSNDAHMYAGDIAVAPESQVEALDNPDMLLAA